MTQHRLPSIVPLLSLPVLGLGLGGCPSSSPPMETDGSSTGSDGVMAADESSTAQSTTG